MPHSSRRVQIVGTALCALAVSAGAGAAPTVAGWASTSSSTAPEMGEKVKQNEVQFGQAEFDAPRDADLLAPPVRGFKLVGYKNAEGITCMAYVGTAKSTTCWPSSDYKFPDGTLHIGGNNPADAGQVAGDQGELPVTFGVGRRDRVGRVLITWPNGSTRNSRMSRRGGRTRWWRGRASPHGR